MSFDGPPVNLGVVGLGRWARVLSAAMGRSDRLRLHAATSRSQEKRDAFAGEYGCQVYPDLASMLLDPDLEGVVITVPNDQHLAVARQVAEAGKHVYVEKPIADSLRDGSELAALGRRQGVQLVVGHSARLLSGTRAIRRAYEAGELGELTLFESNFSNERALTLTPDKWRWYRSKTPGGPLSQLLIHHFDTLRYLGGPIVEVMAMAGHLQTPAEVDDVSTTLLRFEDGKMAYSGSSWVAPGIYHLRAYGTKAAMHFELDFKWWDSSLEVHKHSELYFQALDKGFDDRVRIDLPSGDMFREELEGFATAIRTGVPYELTADNGLQALGVVYAAIRSAETGRAVRVSEVLDEAAAQVGA